VLALCVALALGAAWGLPFVRVAPNRLLSGEPVFLADVIQARGSWLTTELCPPVLVIVVLGLAIVRPRRPAMQAIVAWVAAAGIGGLWLLAGHHASLASQSAGPLTRTTLGAGFWALAALGWMAALDAVARMQLATLLRLLLQGALFLPLLFSLGAGHDLSIAREYANHSDVLGPAILRHLQIVLLSVAPAVAIGVPLAWRITRAPVLRSNVFPVLNVIQTIPSIALFGLLMAPLAWLAAQAPALGRLGISGVGLAPAVLALMLYALLPIVRSTLAGLEQVPDATVTAARAMGMRPWQVLWHVELPLALPALLIGLRTAVVQTTGLAAVTALVGAGGLGSIMFDGLFSAANELVMLGVIPIVLLALLADHFFKVLGSLLERRAA
jgi:osmoprotectant transport system permease protein